MGLRVFLVARRSGLSSAFERQRAFSRCSAMFTYDCALRAQSCFRKAKIRSRLFLDSYRSFVLWWSHHGWFGSPAAPGSAEAESPLPVSRDATRRGIALMRLVGSQFSGSRRGLRVGLALASLMFLANLTAPMANATKYVDRIVGTDVSGATGGLFNTPQEIAVNRTGAGGVSPGTFYVVEQTNNRVQRFSPAGTFERAWGADVNLPSGGTDLEVCTVAANCKAGAASGGNGTAAGNGTLSAPFGVAVDGDTGNVYVVNRAALGVDQYAADGGFIRAFGFDVVASGPGNTGTGYEICVQADGDVCKTGLQGTGIGQI